jgi:hypothetical protein
MGSRPGHYVNIAKYNVASSAEFFNEASWESKTQFSRSALTEHFNEKSLVSILSQMNLVHIFPPYSPKIHSNIILNLSGLFPSDFPTKFCYKHSVCCSYNLSPVSLVLTSHFSSTAFNSTKQHG